MTDASTAGRRRGEASGSERTHGERGQSGPTDGEGLTVPSGLAVLSGTDPRGGGIRQLALTVLAENGPFGEGGRSEAYWIDARNAASTYALYEETAGQRRHAQRPGSVGRRVLEPLRIARAFTAYQHHSLVRRVTRRAGSETSLLVAPNVESLYEDGDVPAYERERLLRSSVAILDELGTALDVPVLASVGDGPLAEVVTEAAKTDVDCRKTSEGYYYAVGEYETTVYWSEGYWQTTIPYWVELFGSVAESGQTAELLDRSIVEAGV